MEPFIICATIVLCVGIGFLVGGIDYWFSTRDLVRTEKLAQLRRDEHRLEQELRLDEPWTPEIEISRRRAYLPGGIINLPADKDIDWVEQWRISIDAADSIRPTVLPTPTFVWEDQNLCPQCFSLHRKDRR